MRAVKNLSLIDTRVELLIMEQKKTRRLVGQCFPKLIPRQKQNTHGVYKHT